jgi:hypothetical protein
MGHEWWILPGVTWQVLTGLFPQICANLGSTRHGFFWPPQIHGGKGGVGCSFLPFIYFLIFEAFGVPHLDDFFFIPPFF